MTTAPSTGPRAEASAELFAAIGDGNRRRILELLAGGERSVRELTEHLGIAQPSVTQHLNVLRAVGLVDHREQGRSRFYRLRPEPLAAVAAWVESLAVEQGRAAAE